MEVERNECSQRSWWWFSCLVMSDICDPMDCSPPGPLSMGFSRQEYWSGLPFHSPGDLSDPGVEPGSPVLQVDSLSSISLSSLYCQTSTEMNMMFIRLSQISVVANIRNIKQGL